jgi:hypothetical protein
VRTQHKNLYNLIQRLFIAVIIAALLPVQLASAQESSPAVEPATTAVPDWLEPRGLSIVDMVGLVPESHLADAILAFDPGVVQYESGQRDGNTVTINVRISPNYYNNGTTTLFSCVGQTAYRDQWPVTVPASSVRIYSGNQDVTQKIVYIHYWESGQIQPIRNPYGNPSDRYPSNQIPSPTFVDGALQLPANSGCNLHLAGDYGDLTAQYTFITASPIQIETLGSQTFTFQSYIGPGGAGRLESLRSQMEGRFPGIRHDKFPLTVPDGADYAFVHYPPTPVMPNPFGDIERNQRQPASGTYRFSTGVNNVLSVDHTASMGMPIFGQWQDADQAPGTSSLPFFSSTTILASPEYFVPTGIGYDPCMTNGGCSTELLDAIYNATMPMTIYYYRVTRTRGGLNRIPLTQVGPAWSPGRSVELREDTELLTAAQVANGEKLYLPLIQSEIISTPEPDDAAGCPCGWFDNLGRMFDYIPPQ